MASNLFPYKPAFSRSGPDHRRNQRQTPSWWTPLFSMSSEPDHFGSLPENKDQDNMIRRAAIENSRPPRSLPNWWTPLYGISSQPDYIDALTKGKVHAGVDVQSRSTNSDKRAPKWSRSGWMTPLFSMSSDPNYIDDVSGSKDPVGFETQGKLGRLAQGAFTEEKARKLRMLTSEYYHDTMYHSAIAAKMASNFKNSEN